MDKQVISFKASEQALTRVGGECRYSSNKVSYIEAHFDLGDNWTGFDSVRAIWFTDFVRGISTVLDSEGICIVPTEVLTRDAKVYVNLVGSIAVDDVLTDRLTSYPIVGLVVDANARVSGDNASSITPSEYEQFVANVSADADRAEDAKEDARGFASDASASATSASESATASASSASSSSASATEASGYADNAEASANSASASASDASASASEAEEWAGKAEQSASDAGYMEFYIDDNGHLIFERTSNVDQVDFSLVNGHLVLEVA